MLIRPLNDIHNEFIPYDIPRLATDADTVLTLAGDIYVKKHLFKWLLTLRHRFKAIVLVLGNHDYWNRDYHKIYQELSRWKALYGFSELHILNCNSVVIDGVTFFGGTMWTDYHRGNPLVRIQCQIMRDFKYIRTNNYTRRLTTEFLMSEHVRFKTALIECLSHDGGKVVVMSHHGPTELSGDHQYTGSPTWWAYVSDLSELILDNPAIELWHHGHIHQHKDYLMGTTRVVCNPRGYAPDELVAEFDPTWVIDLG